MSPNAVRVEPFRPQLDRERLEELRRRLAPGPRWDGPADWGLGVPPSWLRDLALDWHAFDTGAFQRTLDTLPHFRTVLGGVPVHFLHIRGAGRSPLPLLLTHGWPSSFLEYLDVIPLLADPDAHGGEAADAFSLVIPSLPGFGFSTPVPAYGLAHDEVAAIWHRLMTDGLGYTSYVAHGSDLGAGVTARLARAQPGSVLGIHLATPGLAAPPRPWSDEEAAHFSAVQTWTEEEGGYAHVQSTKPHTLSTALADSPLGLAAWIGEKLVSWSSTREDGTSAFPRERLLATLTLYWMTDTIASSLLPYWARSHSAAAVPLTAGQPISTSTSISIFGGERVPFPKPPRALAERYFTVDGWDEHDRGGHFPAVAEPSLLAGILRRVFRGVRHNGEINRH